MNAVYHRPGRVYLEPEPQEGPHEGYRGPLVADSLGVHISTACEYLNVITRRAATELSPGAAIAAVDVTYDSEWVLVEIAVLIPWHRIWAIEWEPRVGEPGHENLMATDAKGTPAWADRIRSPDA
jgi:hypothetical protein